MKDRKYNWWGGVAILLAGIIVASSVLTDGRHLTTTEHSIKGVALGAAAVLFIVGIITSRHK